MMKRCLLLPTVVASIAATMANQAMLANASDSPDSGRFRCSSLAPPFEDIVKRQSANPESLPWTLKLRDLKELDGTLFVPALPTKAEGLPLPALSSESVDCRNVHGTTFQFGEALLTTSSGHEAEECDGSPHLVWKGESGELRHATLPAVSGWTVGAWWCLPNYFVLGLDVHYEGCASHQSIAFWNLNSGKVVQYPSIEVGGAADSMHLNELNFIEIVPDWKLALASEQDGAILLSRKGVVSAFWPDSHEWTVVEAKSGKLLPTLQTKLSQRERPVVPIERARFVSDFQKGDEELRLTVQDTAKIDAERNVLVLYSETSDEFGIFIVDRDGMPVMTVKIFPSPRTFDFMVRIQSASPTEMIVGGAGATYRDGFETWTFDLDLPNKRVTERVQQ